MDKLVKFFTNKWFKRCLSVFSIGYTVLLGFVAWLVMCFYFEPTHEGALFTLYIFLNVIFAVIMLFSRSEFITKLCSMINPLIVFVILILGFGDWFTIVPPCIICLLTFFFCRTGETQKIVLGTLYLILYVVGVLVFLTLENLMGNMSILDVDLSTRSTTYNYSPDKQYRIVTYVEPEKDQNRTVSFYLEKTEGDLSLPFLECRRVMGSIHLITSSYDDPAELEWKNKNTLYIDGRLREYDFDAPDTDEEDIFADLFNKSDDEEESDSSTESGDSSASDESADSVDSTDSVDNDNDNVDDNENESSDEAVLEE